MDISSTASVKGGLGIGAVCWGLSNWALGALGSCALAGVCAALVGRHSISVPPCASGPVVLPQPGSGDRSSFSAKEELRCNNSFASLRSIIDSEFRSIIDSEF